MLQASVSRVGLQLLQRRWLSSASKNKTPAFCFDIDGVLKQGSYVLPQALEALSILRGNNKLKKRYPFVLCTNGGGVHESVRAKKLSKELGVEIGEHEVVQSHTLFRGLVKDFGDKPVLVLGGMEDHCRIVAERYGFKHAYIAADVQAWNKTIWPFHELTTKELGYVKKRDFSQIQFAAILIFPDGRDWGRDIQVGLDVLASPTGTIGTSASPTSYGDTPQGIPVYVSNPDLLWGNEFPQPRLGTGAFVDSFKAVYKQVTGNELELRIGGKPTKATYDYVSKLLYTNIAALEGETIEDAHTKASLDPAPPHGGTVYMVGDNPASDIAGATAFGWSSILVRTGVFRGKSEDAPHNPTVVAKDVLEGIKWALKREGEDVL